MMMTLKCWNAQYASNGCMMVLCRSINLYRRRMSLSVTDTGIGYTCGQLIMRIYADPLSCLCQAENQAVYLTLPSGGWKSSASSRYSAGRNIFKYCDFERFRGLGCSCIYSVWITSCRQFALLKLYVIGNLVLNNPIRHGECTVVSVPRPSDNTYLGVVLRFGNRTFHSTVTSLFKWLGWRKVIFRRLCICKRWLDSVFVIVTRLWAGQSGVLFLARDLSLKLPDGL
jgi:hypothetical protein